MTFNDKSHFSLFIYFHLEDISVTIPILRLFVLLRLKDRESYIRDHYTLDRGERQRAVIFPFSWRVFPVFWGDFMCRFVIVFTND